MCLRALKYDVELACEVPEQFWEDNNGDPDPEILELTRCKDGNGTCKITEYGSEFDGGVVNCHNCHKVVCDKHRNGCCRFNRFFEDEYCSYKIEYKTADYFL